MELFEAIHQRRSVQKFAPTAVPREILLELVDAARYSPSGSNKNPWRFIIVTQRGTLDRLSETHPHSRWLGSAQAGIAIVVDPKASRYWLEDCCLAAYAVSLAATGHGLSARWAAMHQSDNPAEGERRQSYVRSLLSIPDGIYVPIVLGIGYPAVAPNERTRPALNDIVFYESMSSKSHL